MKKLVAVAVGVFGLVLAVNASADFQVSWGYGTPVATDIDGNPLPVGDLVQLLVVVGDMDNAALAGGDDFLLHEIAIGGPLGFAPGLIDTGTKPIVPSAYNGSEAYVRVFDAPIKDEAAYWGHTGTVTLADPGPGAPPQEIGTALLEGGVVADLPMQQTIPEPSMYAVLALAGLAFLGYRRFRK
jgi:hypothetical protein